jgi:predicted acyl esterase
MSLTNRSHDGPADIDVYVALRKFDAAGNQVFYMSSTNSPQAATYGWIRASHRAVSHQPYPEFEGELPWPTLSHRHEDFKPVKSDEVYELRTELWPTNVVVAKGETIVLEVSPTDVEGAGPYLTVDQEMRYVCIVPVFSTGPGWLLMCV